MEKACRTKLARSMALCQHTEQTFRATRHGRKCRGEQRELARRKALGSMHYRAQHTAQFQMQSRPTEHSMQGAARQTHGTKAATVATIATGMKQRQG